MATRDTPDAGGVSAASTQLQRFSSFVVVGGVGFIIDAAVLSLLVRVWN